MASRKIFGKSGYPIAKYTLASLASLQEAPPDQQRINRIVMPASWSDPADMQPNRRNAREIEGFRQICMLRWCRRRHGDASRFSIEHIVAADELRRIYDLVTIGMTGKKDPWIFHELYTQPKLGPTRAETQRYRAWQELARVQKRFSERDWVLLCMFLLSNLAIGRQALRLAAASQAGLQSGGLSPSADPMPPAYRHADRS
jgi:hypothetical protein